MKKALITMIIILSAFILGIVMFVVGVQITSEKDGESEEKTGAAASLDGKEDGSSLGNNSGQAAAPIDQDYDPLGGEEEEAEPEEKTEEEPEKEPEEEQGIELDAEPEPSVQTSYPDYPQSSNEWYRVRTSAGSDGKQDGAFKSFANAKAHATTLKAQGYKVYDNNMNCIYIP